METPARLRLYQYVMSPYCIPIELVLRHSGIPYDVVNLHVSDPAPVIQLTKGDYYQVPVIEDLFRRELIYDRSPAGDDVPRYLASQAPLMNLFPEKVAGLQRILIAYVENECEPLGFKINDAHREKWLKNDMERGLHRRHKERKFGPGCLEEWTRDEARLSEQFYTALQPFEEMLGQNPFLTGEQPVYADYALCGVIGNFLFSGATSLPAHYLMLEAWYTRMRAGNFRNPLEEMQHGEFGSGSGVADGSNALADMSDLEKTISDLKLRTASQVLDVPTATASRQLIWPGRALRLRRRTNRWRARLSRLPRPSIWRLPSTSMRPSNCPTRTARSAWSFAAARRITSRLPRNSSWRQRAC